MTTATTQPASHPQPQAAQAVAPQLVSFCFYRLDPAWRRLPRAAKNKHAGELQAVVQRFSKRLMVPPPAGRPGGPRPAVGGAAAGEPAGGGMVLSYSLIGLKADVDFLLWRVGTSLEDLQEMSREVRQTQLAGYLTLPYSYLSMTKRSTYVDKLDPDHQDTRRFVTPFHSKYLFVYPFVKTSEWYQLPFEQRQAMMDEHIVLGNKYRSVRIHTTYSFGLDDPEFVLAFETDEPKDFLDLVMEMRESKARPYTLRDTPIFTCVAKPFGEILKDLGG